MRVVLADIRSPNDIVSKDTVVGGYGSRLSPFSNVTNVIARIKCRLNELPSVQLGYLAAIATNAGHDVVWTNGALVDGDVAVVLSSLVDYRSETGWADKMRERGVRVGFIGLAASKLPELFQAHAHFIITGEPETAFSRLIAGQDLSGLVSSEEVRDLDTLPFPRWDLFTDQQPYGSPSRLRLRPFGRGFPVLASRSCPEFCTYCPHRILATYRFRSVGSLVDELEQLCAWYPRPHVVFRDPLFSQDRKRCLHLADEIHRRQLELRFECETRLDRLDPELLDRLHEAGLRAIGFGVESVSAETLRKVGRRPIPLAHQRMIIDHCRSRGILTAAFYVLGFFDDDWESIAATIDYATDLGSTLAQFKLFTPYPGTPLWRRFEPLVQERDWEKFDGFTPTFHHPNLTARELCFLLGAAYTRFYVRPSFFTNYLGLRHAQLRRFVGHLDRRVSAQHARKEIRLISRAVTC